MSVNGYGDKFFEIATSLKQLFLRQPYASRTTWINFAVMVQHEKGDPFIIAKRTNFDAKNVAFLIRTPGHACAAYYQQPNWYHPKGKLYIFNSGLGRLDRTYNRPIIDAIQNFVGAESFAKDCAGCFPWDETLWKTSQEGEDCMAHAAMTLYSLAQHTPHQFAFSTDGKPRHEIYADLLVRDMVRENIDQLAQ